MRTLHYTLGEWVAHTIESPFAVINTTASEVAAMSVSVSWIKPTVLCPPPSVPPPGLRDSAAKGAAAK